MDRFIENGCSIIPKANENLKSNMDRFIDSLSLNALSAVNDLKSNMDRFIAFSQFPRRVFLNVFKIQYG